MAVVQDELWRVLRAAPGLVERSDRITRLNRHRGVISFQVTHSLDDLEALPSETDLTFPTSPAPLTTGSSTLTPSLEPLLIFTCWYQVLGERW